MLSLTILCDNNTIIDNYLLGEPGLSFWIECGGRRFLFDTGYSDVFIRNAAQMKIDITQADALIYSHGHNDHTWGTHALVTLFDRMGTAAKPRLVAHPRVFENKTADGHVIGTMMKAEALSNYFDIRLSPEPLELAPGLWWLGEIPELATKRGAVGYIAEGGAERDDFCLDDSALAYKGTDGLVIITGCSHSGICNITEHARNVTGESRVADIIGGMHLLGCHEPDMEGIIGYFKSAGVRRLHPCHCTDLAAKAALSRAFPVEECGSGTRLKFN